MKSLTEQLRRGHRALGLFLVAWWLTSAALVAEPIRIVSWNLTSLENTADKNAPLEARLNSAALALRKLQPDVVLLQEVPDWKTAIDLASRIDTRFGVRICSAYAGATATQRSSRQMAVLSRFNSSITFHEGWRGTPTHSGVGYAFAMLDIQGTRVGFASLVLPEATTTGESATRLVAAGQFFVKLAEIRGWTANGPDAFFFGGTLASGEEVTDAVLQRAREEGFVSAYLNLPREARATLRAREDRPALTTDYIFGEGGGYVAPVQLTPNIVSEHAILAVDWDPNRSMPVIMVSEPALAAADETVPPGTPAAAGDAPVQAAIDLFGIDLKWWVLGLGGAVLLLIILMIRRPAPRAFDAGRALPASSGDKILFLSDPDAAGRAGGNPTLTEAERRHVRPHLLRWLKGAFIGGLLRQRSDLMNVHDTAARQADALGKRMEQIQDKLIDRIHKAESRVSELERELAVAKSENRELIESNLLLAQRELAEARAKVAAGRAG
jgi:hypothetical protein